MDDDLFERDPEALRQVSFRTPNWMDDSFQTKISPARPTDVYRLIQFLILTGEIKIDVSLFQDPIIKIMMKENFKIDRRNERHQDQKAGITERGPRRNTHDTWKSKEE